MKSYFLITSFFISLLSLSQMPDVSWQKTIGGSLSDELNSVLLTNDGGFLLGGTSESNISGEKADTSKGGKDYWIVKLDSLRNIEWQKTIGGSSTDELKQIVKSNDGGYLLGGFSESNISSDKTENSIGSFDYWIVKIDSVGNIEWDKTIGGSENDQLIDMVALSEYGYILAGNSSSDISGSKTEDSEGYQDFWIVMIDSIGDIEWQNTIGGDTTETLFSIELTSDNGFILAGHTKSDISGDKSSPLIGSWDYWMVKLDDLGAIEWDWDIGVEGFSVYAVAFETEDGGYQISGTSTADASGIKSEDSPGGQAYWVLKLNAEGELIWENTIGAEGDDILTTAIPTLDGGSLIAGHSDSHSSFDKSEDSNSKAFWLVKLNSEGIIEWENTITGSSTDIPTTIIQLNADEFIVGGRSNSNSFLDKYDPKRGHFDYWLLKLGYCDYIENSVTEHYFGGAVRTLEANADDYDYQWYECVTFFSRVPVLGATERSFTPWDTAGEYAVRISENDCSTFSDCFFVTGILNIEENKLSNALNIYPNPTVNEVHINYDQDVSVEVINKVGEVVLVSNSTDFSISSLSVGTYLLKIYDTNSNLISLNQVIRIN